MFPCQMTSSRTQLRVTCAAIRSYCMRERSDELIRLLCVRINVNIYTSAKEHRKTCCKKKTRVATYIQRRMKQQCSRVIACFVILHMMQVVSSTLYTNAKPEWLIWWRVKCLRISFSAVMTGKESLTCVCFERFIRTRCLALDGIWNCNRAFSSSKYRWANVRPLSDWLDIRCDIPSRKEFRSWFVKDNINLVENVVFGKSFRPTFCWTICMFADYKQKQ